MSNDQLQKSPTSEEEILYHPRSARTQRPPPNSSNSHATYPQQTIPSTYFTHLADADVPSLFQDIASIRASTEIYRGRPRRVQPVRPDQILRTQHEDRPSNPSDVLQYHLPSAANGGSQRRGQGDGLSTSHDASLRATFSPHRPGFDRLDQYTPRGQLPSWHDGLPMEALGGEDIQVFNDGGYMSEAFLRYESPVLGPAFGPLPSAYSSTPNFPHSNAKSPDQELGLGHGLSSLDSVADMPPSYPQLFHDPETLGVKKYIDDYVKRQIELDSTYGAEFRTEEDGRFD